MHTGQLFPAVCFWKYLIPDAVKYWLSLTSVKALIFLLWLNNLSNKIFLHFWAFTHDLTCTHLPSTLWCLRPWLPPIPPPPPAPATYGCCCCYTKSLELAFIMAMRGATVMIVEIDSPTFSLIMFNIRGKSWKLRSPRARWKNHENILASVNKIQANFCSSCKDSTYRKCFIALYIVASMSVI